jgi:hypothetical protein
MNNGANKSLFTLLVVVIFGIFLALSSFLFKDQFKGILADVVDKTSRSIRYNALVPSNKFDADWTAYPGLGDVYNFTNVNDVITYSSNATGEWTGIKVDYSNFEKDTEYRLAFDITKISGNIKHIGGHVYVSSDSEVFLDNMPVTGDWSAGSTVYPNDTDKHHVEVIFTTDNWSTDDKSVYIQPNRQFVVLTGPYTVRIEDIQLTKY